MLPRSSRLPYREFCSREYRVKKALFFTLKVKKGITKENRLGIVIGVAAEKSAARRNFWKRHANAVFQKIPNAGSDLLLIFSKDIKNATLKDFKKEFLRAAGIDTIT